MKFYLKDATWATILEALVSVGILLFFVIKLIILNQTINIDISVLAQIFG